MSARLDSSCRTLGLWFSAPIATNLANRSEAIKHPRVATPVSQPPLCLGPTLSAPANDVSACGAGRFTPASSLKGTEVHLSSLALWCSVGGGGKLGLTTPCWTRAFWLVLSSAPSADGLGAKEDSSKFVLLAPNDQTFKKICLLFEKLINQFATRIFSCKLSTFQKII